MVRECKGAARLTRRGHGAGVGLAVAAPQADEPSRAVANKHLDGGVDLDVSSASPHEDS